MARLDLANCRCISISTLKNCRNGTGGVSVLYEETALVVVTYQYFYIEVLYYCGGTGMSIST